MDEYAIGAWQAERGNAINAMSALNQANCNIDYLNGVVRDRNTRITRLQEELAVAQAATAGRMAQFEAFKAAHPNSHMLAASGRFFKDGEIKTTARLIYERVFDEKLRGFGISDPAARRAD